MYKGGLEFGLGYILIRKRSTSADGAMQESGRSHGNRASFSILLFLPISFPIAIHPPLHAQADVTQGLEYATHLEGPRYLPIFRHEEETHFHRITQQPICKNTYSEASA